MLKTESNPLASPATPLERRGSSGSNGLQRPNDEIGFVGLGHMQGRKNWPFVPIRSAPRAAPDTVVRTWTDGWLCLRDRHRKEIAGDG